MLFLVEASPDYGTVTVSGALVALAVREGIQYLSKRNANGTQEVQTELLTQMRDGINELVQDSRTRRTAEATATAIAMGKGAGTI